MTDGISNNLKSTLAYQIAAKLDAQDGNANGEISASIWNKFVEDKGGKQIKESISLKSAMNSITTYLVRQAKSAGQTVDTLAQDWLGKVNSSETPASGETKKSGGTEQADGTDKSGGTEKTGGADKTGGANKTQAQKDAEAVRVTVQMPPMPIKPDDSTVKGILDAQKEGQKIAAELSAANTAIGKGVTAANIKKFKAALEQINKDNVAYVLREIPNLPELIDGIDYFGSGLDKKDVAQYVLEPLQEKANELKTKTGLRADVLNNPDKYTIDSIASTVNKMRQQIIAKNTKTVNDYNEKIQNEYNPAAKKYNEFAKNKSKIQKTFDDANKFLADTANMDPKPEIEKDAESRSKKATLSDGRGIKVYYDDKGEISEIKISHDTTPDKNSDGSTFDGAEISYTKDMAWYDIDKNNDEFEGSITSGYDFGKLKALATKLFGEFEE